jgi:hypothetical protein
MQRGHFVSNINISLEKGIYLPQVRNLFNNKELRIAPNGTSAILSGSPWYNPTPKTTFVKGGFWCRVNPLIQNRSSGSGSCFLHVFRI